MRSDSTETNLGTDMTAPESRVMTQRVAYGALAIMIVVSVFLVDVTIARLCERPDTVLPASVLEGKLGSFFDTLLDGPIGSLCRRGSALPLFTILVMLLGTAEFVRLARDKGINPHSTLIYVMVALMNFAPWFSAAGWLGSRPNHVEGMYWSIIAVAMATIGAAVTAVRRGRPEGMFRDIGATLTIILLLGFLGSFTLQLRCDRDIPGQEGAWLLLIVVLVTKASDIGAYFVGSTIGRRKLAPQISPGKSVEGMIGGLVASALVATGIVLSGASRTFCLGGDGQGFQAIWQPVLFGIAIAATGQLGDLLESCFKRDAGSKDSGKLLPRFGGILDLIDSPVVAIPVAWFLLTEVWPIA